MNKPRKSFTIQEGKIQASILLKSLGSPDKKIAMQAAKRMQKLAEFSDETNSDILQKKLQRKHALAVIAIENGFTSWSELKSQMSFVIAGFLNQWFASYSAAKEYQQKNGGFLFPYKKQFFICEAEYIHQLGLDPHDPDWQLIGFDWAQPADKKASQRLNKKWAKIQGDNNE